MCQDCPICFESIDNNVGCATTECGHKFHLKCLMNNVAHNGFNCPYCRSEMADNLPKDDDCSNYEGFSDDDSFIDDEDEERYNDQRQFSDDALRAFRFMVSSLNQETPDDADIQEEIDSINEEQNVKKRIEMRMKYVMEKLAESTPNYGYDVNTIVMKLLLETICCSDDPDRSMISETINNNIYKTYIRNITKIVSTYTDEKEREYIEELRVREEKKKEREENIMFALEDKPSPNVTIRNNRRHPMIHM